MYYYNTSNLIAQILGFFIRTIVPIISTLKANDQPFQYETT